MMRNLASIKALRSMVNSHSNMPTHYQNALAPSSIGWNEKMIKPVQAAKHSFKRAQPIRSI